MNRVCFISVYFGNIPEFFKTFFDSCGWNPGFDWLIIHDKSLRYHLPKNVHDVSMNLDEFRRKVVEKVGIAVPEIKPYKVCDYRPAFGIIFEEYLHGYEFWGICDSDLILGDLSKYITSEILDSYDKIFTMGHMSLVRNNEICNWIFKNETDNSRNYEPIFQSSSNCIYDEFDGFTEKFSDNGLRVYKEKKCGDISETCGRLRVNERWLIRCIQPKNRYINYSKDSNYKHQVFWISNGKTYRSYIDEKDKLVNEEYSYIHKLDFACSENLNSNDSRIITTNGYVKDDQYISQLINGKMNANGLDVYNKASIFREKWNDLYWYLRWHFRHFRASFIGGRKLCE